MIEWWWHIPTFLVGVLTGLGLLYYCFMHTRHQRHR
jgi:hypothetical protein